MTTVGGTLIAVAPRRVETDGHRFFEVHRHALGIGVVCLVAGLVLAVIVERDPVRPLFQDIDDGWIAWSEDHRSAGLVRTAEVISVLGGVTVLLPLRLVAAIVLAARQRWLQLAVFIAAVVSSEVLIGVLKSWTDRPRPPGSLVETTGASFPSGHAIAGAVTALALVVALVPARAERLRYTGLAAAFAAVMAMSRVYLAAHWFSDVVAGTLLGVGIALIWPATLELVRERRIGPATPSTVPVATSAVTVEGRLKRRRPSGERPPLPRPVPVQARRALVTAGGVILVWGSLELRFGESSWMRRVDRSLLAVVADHRASWMVAAARAIDTVTHVAVVHAVVLLVLVALLCVRQVRRAIVFGAALLGTEVVVAAVSNGMQRPRPYNAEILGSWAGYASPSAAVAALTSLLLAVGLAFVPSGVARRRAMGAAVAVVAMVATARVVLAVDHVSDMVAGAAIAAVIVIGSFLWLVPDASFPIRYRGQRAHVQLDDARKGAIKAAMRQQLGVQVESIRPIGAAGSAGSTPLLLRTDRSMMFAKLLAERHLRADRQYKFVRAVLYGRLEDERPFHSVRRLTMNEDYLLRLFAAARAPVVASHGVVELTPQREYLIVTEFADGARELGDPDLDITDDIIDEALQAVRRLWDAGLAHRDIKPSNVMVRDGHVLLIDVGFAELRPSPWRQAVDLANMLLCLALRTNAERVYRRSLANFTPDDVAEAMAATCSITVPSQLHAAIAADGRRLVDELRALAPARPRITIQRWTARRVWLLAATLLGGMAATYLVWSIIFGHDSRDVAPPTCGSATELLVAQSVPSAVVVPCLRSDAGALEVITAEIEAGRTAFTLATIKHGVVTVTVSAECDHAATRAVVAADGVCVAVTGDVTAAEATDLLDGQLTLTPRSQLDDEVRRRTDDVVARLSPPTPPEATD
jgi:membrane-associated phospholipid phosphatase/tRNA A-37 threonylcarbamoyl transferase component Bud32